MKKSIFLILMLTVLLGCAQKRMIRYQVTQTQPYCGGARPTPDMEKDAHLAKPYMRKTLIYISSKGKVDSVKTDDNGFFSINVKKGTYKFYEPWKYYKKSQDGSPIDHFDKKCLEAEWKKEDILMKAGKKTETVTNNISEGKCQWQYPCYLKEHAPHLPE